MPIDPPIWQESVPTIQYLSQGRVVSEEESLKKGVEIISKATVFQKSIFRVEEVHLRHERYKGGMTHEFVRLNLDRGDSVAALLHNQIEGTVLLTEQFRYPTCAKGPGWMIELPAGIINSKIGETPEACVRREILEEIGYSVENSQHICTFYLSPGGSSERIHLYYANITKQNCIKDGGGLVESDEDIQRLSLSVDLALEKVASGEIMDAKTIVALQWLQNHSTH